MYLSEIKLWNFRQFGSGNSDKTKVADLKTSFTPGLNLLVGENDSGKTTVVDAINYIVIPQSYENMRIRHDDFYMDEDWLRIECVFTGFTSNQAKTFVEYLTIDNEKVDEINKEKLSEDLLLEKQIANLKLTLFLEAERNAGDKPLWHRVKVKVGDEVVELSSDIRFQFLRSMYLKPLRDAESELTAKPYSRLSQILLKHKSFEETKGSKHPLTTVFSTANVDIRGFFDGDFADPEKVLDIMGRLYVLANKKIEHGLDTGDEAELNQLLDEYHEIKSEDGISGKLVSEQIGEHLNKFLSKKRSKTAKFDISDQQLSQVLQKLNLELDEKRSGLGALNILFMSAELLLLAREKTASLQLGIIEEAEAHLHTQAQMRVLDYLQQLANKSTDSMQLFVTTHSTHIASKIRLENLVLFRDGAAFSMAPVNTKLSVGDYEFLERFLDATKSNLFFAEGVLIVEGDAENILLPSLAKVIDRDLVSYGVSIVNVGHSGLTRFSNIFLRSEADKSINIPVANIKDLDVNYKPYLSDGQLNFPTNIKDIELTKWEEKISGEEQSVRNFISPHKTLEFDLAFDVNIRPLFIRAVFRMVHSNRKNGDNIFLQDEDALLAADKEADSFLETAILEGKSNEQIAYEIYKKCKKHKSVTAQFFAQVLEDLVSDKDLTPKGRVLNQIVRMSLVSKLKNSKAKYLIDAIGYVTEPV